MKSSENTSRSGRSENPQDSEAAGNQLLCVAPSHSIAAAAPASYKVIHALKRSLCGVEYRIF